jgi:hypothetical protein
MNAQPRTAVCRTEDSDRQASLRHGRLEQDAPVRLANFCQSRVPCGASYGRECDGQGFVSSQCSGIMRCNAGLLPTPAEGAPRTSAVPRRVAAARAQEPTAQVRRVPSLPLSLLLADHTPTPSGRAPGPSRMLSGRRQTVRQHFSLEGFASRLVEPRAELLYLVLEKYDLREADQFAIDPDR